ncbi:MAG: PTS sugar transporter subunit IIA [Sporolactobacillus sp.]|jgi:PTS system N-acetylgalactosamine-specific IIA component|nr:PTS sugar transporter subunit IIA [Sporolactobacillus sp.]
MKHVKYIVTGHGNFAGGIRSTVKLLAGDLDCIAYIDFTEGMSDKQLYDRLSDEVQKDADDSYFLIFTDLLGGTPFKQAALLSTTSKRLSVVAGCNVGSLLECALSQPVFSDIRELAQTVVTISKKNTTYFGEHQAAPKNEDSDGI